MLTLKVLSLSIHSLKKCLYYLLVKLEQNHVVQTTQNFELFDKKFRFLKQLLTSIDAILEDVSVAETIV